MFEESSVREITWLSWRHRFRKTPFSKSVPSTRKPKAGVFKFLLPSLKSVFEKLRFRDRLQCSEDGRPSRRNNAAFSNSSGLMWPGPHFKLIHCSRIRQPARSNLFPRLPTVSAWPLPADYLKSTFVSEMTASCSESAVLEGEQWLIESRTLWERWNQSSLKEKNTYVLSEKTKHFEWTWRICTKSLSTSLY